jgi:hypothetical protein
LYVNGNTNINGDLTATRLFGDGSGITNINAAASGWAQTGTGGIYPTVSRVGVGNNNPQYNLHLGTPGTNNIDLYVENRSTFNGTVTTQNLTVNGILSSSSYRLTGGTGLINAGIVTASTLVAGNNAIRVSSNSVGIGTVTPRANLDIDGSVRFKSYSEAVVPVSVSSNNVTLDLSQGQTFTLTATSNANQFTLTNVPSGSTAFTILITQNSVGGNSVNIDSFRTSGGVTIPVYWPGGGVIPTVTTGANRSDIYSFKTFDGGATLYGFVGGQNFA